MTVGAHDIAARLVEEQLAAGRSIDKMQLQKLLYLVKGAHYTLWDGPGFREPLRAFKHGPAVTGVEATYREAFPDQRFITRPIGGSGQRLPDDLEATIQVVLDTFGTWGAPRLARYTKQPGGPWDQAREDLPPTASSRMAISEDAIRSWFGRHPLSPEAALTNQERASFARLADGDLSALSVLLA